MKRNEIIIRSAIAACFILLLSGLNACEKKTEDAAMGTFYFHIHSDIDTSEIEEPGTFYTDANGRRLALSTAKFFLSNVTLRNANGKTYTISGAYILAGLDSEEYIIGKAPVGTYTGVSFTVGVDAATNATTPSSHATGPLSDAAAWYGTTERGYKFMCIMGAVDTSVAHNQSGLVHFSYTIGGSDNLETVTMPARTGALTPYVLTKDGTQYIHLIADYGKLLSVMNIPHAANTPGNDTTDSYNVFPLIGSRIASNIPNMFTYEE